MIGTPLLLGTQEATTLADLKTRAEEAVIDLAAVMPTLSTEEGMRAHRARMGRLTVPIPANYEITFSLEDGHPCGRSRHMSMSVSKQGRVPNEQAVWMVAEHLGFRGGLVACAVWPEEFGQGMIAINVLQPLES